MNGSTENLEPVKMTASTAFVFASALSAVFGIVYLPVLMRQPKAFVSPYAKADIRKRASAAIADGLLVATCVVLYGTRDSVFFIAVGAAYLLLRDALFIPGQSIGKFLFGLRVISLDNGRPCSRLHSAQRNCILLVPGLNVVAAVLEAAAIVRDPQGQRLGDTLANTQVVEGLSARELATSLQRALLDVPSGQRDKQPVEVK
jgi:uncharacterized RDD family membrane protein YckC